MFLKCIKVIVTSDITRYIVYYDKMKKRKIDHFADVSKMVTLGSGVNYKGVRLYIGEHNSYLTC